LSLTGREGEAQQFSRRAMELREELAEGHRAARLPDLAALGDEVSDGAASTLPGMARQLTNHASQLAWGGRPEEALAVSRRVVERYRDLADDDRDAYLPDLAAGLSGFARLRVTLNTDLANALPAADQAFHVYQQLAVQEPEKFSDSLLDAAKTLADALKALGRVEEAEQIHRDLASRSGGMNARGQ
jgi:tetratricopeptide (TPR) repeat protein